MKTKNTLLGTLFVFAFAGNAIAQISESIKKGVMEKNMRADTAVHLTSFTARIISENAYLKWTVTSLKQDGIFLVYFSSDGITFSVIGDKTAIGVPVKNDIAYYFNCKASTTT